MSEDVEFARRGIDSALFADGASPDGLAGDAPSKVPDEYELRRCLGRGGAGVVGVARELALWDANRYRISRNLARTFPQLDGIVARHDVHLERHPDCARARSYRGQTLFRRGRLQEAREDLERAVLAVRDGVQPGTLDAPVWRALFAAADELEAR